MKAVVIVTHGIKRQASKDDVRDLTNIITKETSNDYPIVETGFLQLTEPLIPDAIISCINQVETDACIVPYLLSTAHHVQEDVLTELNKAHNL